MEKDNEKTNIDKCLYLGLLVIEPIEKIHDIIIKGLKQITSVYKGLTDAEELISSMENSIVYSKWRYPKADKKWHITTLFKKGKTFTKSHPAYTSFEKDKGITVDVRGLVYIPEKIIFCICFPDTPVENQFPHMTTLLGEYSAKHSNDVMKELFGSGCQFEDEYESVFKVNLNDKAFLEECGITLFKKKEKCYIIKFEEPISLETVMHAFAC
jgi:hypothetical protein